MKKLFFFSLVAMMALPAFADTTMTTTEETFQDPTVIEAEEYDRSLIDEDSETVEAEEMEAVDEKEDEIDYSDRTRTNRERKALHTGSHASDDN